MFDLKREVRSLEMAAWGLESGTVSAPGAAEYVDGLAVSSDLFPVLGVNVARGRRFLPSDDRPAKSGCERNWSATLNLLDLRHGCVPQIAKAGASRRPALSWPQGLSITIPRS